MPAERENPSLTIGLTGGIASGKSTVAGMFADLGVSIIDTDIIARELVQPGRSALQEIREQFGADVIAADGSLDRGALRGIVFADADKRQQLESILHPQIREETLRQAAAASGPYRIIVVPLLVGSPMRSSMDRVLVVDCPEDVQLARLLERDADSIEQAKRMIEAQASREERLGIADDVLENSGGLDATRHRVAELHARYTALAGSQHAPG